MARFLVWLLSQPLFWAVAGATLGPYLFFRGFRLLQLKRRIMNVPRSSIRSAALGPVEVSGTAVGPYTVVSPLSEADCLYYRLVVESNPRGDLGTKTKELCAPLFLDDGTGVLMIYPPGAELRMKPSADRAEYGKLAVTVTSRYRAEVPEFSQEYSIKPGDKLFVLGTLQENVWAGRKNIADFDDLSRIGPGFVCEGEADLQRRESFPFLNSSVPAGAKQQAAREFDLNPPVILTGGSSSSPFVICSDTERELLAKLSWHSLLCIWGGPLAALWGIWELLVVRPGLFGSPFQ